MKTITIIIIAISSISIYASQPSFYIANNSPDAIYIQEKDKYYSGMSYNGGWKIRKHDTVVVRWGLICSNTYPPCPWIGSFEDITDVYATCELNSHSKQITISGGCNLQFNPENTSVYCVGGNSFTVQVDGHACNYL